MKLDKTIKVLIVLAVVANSVGMFFPALRSTFTPYYASIAKHIILSNNWADLVFSGHDWLDKPHLPFWLSAISFKVFGINSFAYILPGFIFHLIGLYFTYKVARFWYDNKNTALLAVLFTATSLHLMLSAIDVRAEAYLLGEIMPACYYWLCFDKKAKFRYLLGGAFFTALALMTKGIFILITIISGIAALWIYRGRWKNFISIKWVFALGLSFIFIAPELIALYQQFDAHPEKVVFGHTHVSGIRWFFIDSQFGRFFNTGPIMSTNPSAWHYLFFVHTFLWAYLPWWPMFIGSVWSIGKSTVKNRTITEANLYLLTSFFVTFILFSLTTFQVDHYTNILFPFASIICANWFVKMLKHYQLEVRHPIFYIENLIALLLLVIIFFAAALILNGVWLGLVIGLCILAILTVVYYRFKDWPLKTIIYPTVAVSILFIFAMVVNGVEYAKYDAGYQIARYLSKNSKIPVYGYKIDMLSLDFHSTNQYSLIDDLDFVKREDKPFYVVTGVDKTNEVMAMYPSGRIVRSFAGSTIETFLSNVSDKTRLTKCLDKYIIIRVE